MARKRIVNEERVCAYLTSHGCSFLSMSPIEVGSTHVINGKCRVFKYSDTLVNYICKCGSPTERTWRHFMDGLSNHRCPKCVRESQIKLRPSTTSSLKEVDSWFIDSGATPLFINYKNNRDKLLFKCRCGNIHTIPYNKKSLGRVPQCRSCSYSGGSSHPRWNSTLTEEDRKRSRYGRGAKIGTWYRKVLEKFKFTCVITGEKGVELSAHHLNSYADFPEERYLISNGVCLKKELHIKFHKIYGYKGSTIQDFKEFFKNETNKDFIIDE